MPAGKEGECPPGKGENLLPCRDGVGRGRGGGRESARTHEEEEEEGGMMHNT